jgi:uroporphyrinogen decarboxylase
MKREPNFERLKKAILRQGEPDFVPIMEFYINTNHKDRFLRERNIFLPERLFGQKNVQREATFWYEAGYDYVPIEISLRKHPENIQGTKLVKARESLFLDYTKKKERDSSLSWVEHVKGLIKDTDDLENFPWPCAEELDYTPLENINKYLPDSIKVIIQPGRLFQGVWAFMGFEEFCFALYERPDFLKKLFDKVCGIQYELVKKAIEFKNVKGVWLGDDLAYTTGVMIHPKYYQKYLFPWYKKIGDICKKYDALFIFHSDGNISEIFNDLIECGIDAIHPIEPKVMDIKEVKTKIGNKLGIIGNIDLNYTLTEGTPEEVIEEVKERIKYIAPGGGYCLSSGNSIPDYVPYNNYDTMRKAALKYGMYPISL